MPETNYPIGVAPANWRGGALGGDGQHHAWTNRPGSADRTRKALCGIDLAERPAAAGLFNTDSRVACALCKVRARHHRPPRWTW